MFLEKFPYRVKFYTKLETMSRRVYVEAFEEHSTYSSMIFLVHLVQAFPMPIECVQTDNVTEFTKRFSKASPNEDLTLFERNKGIRHQAKKDSSLYPKTQRKSRTQSSQG